MADFDDWTLDGGDADQAGGAAAPPPRIDGGLLDPSTFLTPWPPITDSPQLDRPAPEITGPLDTDVHAQVLQDILDAQAKLPPIDRPAPLVNGPLMTDPHAEVFQNFLNAQAGLPSVKPHPETWSVNGQPYLAIGAGTFDPSRSNHVTAMPTPEESAAAVAGRFRVGVPVGDEEKAGFISHSPSRVVSVAGTAGSGLGFDTYSYLQPVGFPPIHGHIDQRPPGSSEEPSDGFVDSTKGPGGLGDAWSLYGPNAEPLATVSHNRVGWHVLDNGQLKFLYPPGSMGSSQIGRMQKNLDDEQQKFLRPQ
jgi:hypothetical protein